MTLEQSGLILAMLGGGLGGVASYFYQAFDGFRALPRTAPSRSKRVRNQRIFFFIMRVVFGCVTAIIFSFLFMDNYVSGGISDSKFIFISSTLGFSTSVLATTVKKIQQLLG